MIAALRGTLIQKIPGSAVVEAGGVGYETLISLATYEALPELGQEARLLVQTIVREDTITLYGFAEAEEKQLFLLLIGVSGIGPKLALAVLGGLGAAGLRAAVMNRDLARLTAAPGVGKKTAERICMELAEKVGDLGVAGIGVAAAGQGRAAAPAAPSPQADAASALVNLGYSEQQAWQALRAIEKDESAATWPVEEWLRHALRRLSAR